LESRESQNYAPSISTGADAHAREYDCSLSLEDGKKYPRFIHAAGPLLASEPPSMEAYRVSRAVNTPRNNQPALLEQVA